MKSVFILFGLLASSCAFPSEEIDIISRLTPRHIEVPLPEKYRNDQPALRIINGRDAEPGTLRYQAGLVMDNRNICGGSLIRHNYVLTAAHCAENVDEFQVILGSHTITDKLVTHQVIVSKLYYIHPAWNITTRTNDVAIIKIDSVADNPSVEIIPLAPGNASDFANAYATLSGWGRFNRESIDFASYLQVVELQIMTNKECSNDFPGFIQSQHICTRGNYSGHSAGPCNGDSGGPLVVNGLQVGIVSFGSPGCGAGMSSAYSRVSSFAEYIESIAGRE
ncbi:unnamed protein product [Ceutorhynchus assimilis]|uniref:Peptidase S1 domain-containing protein n=1 Tax=Ceutorhynchus assimilis TaxID=467358 RepID=A0A9N9QM71_9CUCU|nr:unnamed protein product [Ceutorhynchus assimilis]